jgi:hypothetical protein
MKLLYEINCKEDTEHRLLNINYDEDGKVLFSVNTPSEWNYIPRNSIIEELKNRVCK